MDINRRVAAPLVATTLAAGSLLAGTGTATATNHWPDDQAWVPVRVAGTPVGDVAGDGVMTGYMDVVGDAEHPAAYVHTSPDSGTDGVADEMAFRLRLDANPAHTTWGDILNGQWIVQLSTNEDPNAYDMAVMVQGGGAERMVVFKNTDRACCANDYPEEEVWEDRLWVDSNVRAVPADTSWSGNPDYFLDWQVPISDGTNAMTGATGPVRFLFGTSLRSYGMLDGDSAGPNGAQTAWEPIGSDVYARSLADGNLVLDMTPPTAELLPPPAFALGKAAISWSGADPDTGIAGYDLRRRTARWDTALAAESTVLTRSPLTGLQTALAKGSTACYTVRSVNNTLLASEWSGPQCAARPLDQTTLSVSSGWRTVAGSAFWGGNATVSDKRGATLTLPGVRATRVALVATTCSSCGKVEVLLDGVSRGVVDLRSATTRNRSIVELPPFPKAKGKLQLRVVSTGKVVKIDGVGISAG